MDERMGAERMGAEAEREVKVAVTDGFEVPDLGGRGLVHGPPRARHLEATFWDSADLRLTRRGHMLRHRRGDDDGGAPWSLKLAEDGDGPVLARRHLSAPGPGHEPPAVLVDVLRAVLGGAVLVAVGRLRHDQQRSTVSDGRGRPVLHVEDDRYEVLDLGHGDAVVAHRREIEVELADGGADGDGLLERAAQRLRRAGADRPDRTPKMARHLGALAAAPADPAPVELDRRSTVEDLVRSSLADATRRLLDHDPVLRLAGHDVEAVHQARVATRRLRSDLRTLRPLLDRAVTDPLRDELRWIGGLLGAVRDADVLAELVGERSHRLQEDGHPDAAAAADAALAGLDRQRDEARAALLAGLASPRYLALVHRLVVAATVAPLGHGVEGSARAAEVTARLFRRPWKRLRQAVRQLDQGQGADGDWHLVRRRAKAARYAAELVTPVVGRRAEKLARRLAAVQSGLGDHHDLVTLRQWLDAASADGTLGVDHARILTDGLDREAARALDSWPHRWAAAREPQLRHW